MFTPVFDKIDGTDYTLEMITVCNANGDEFDDKDVGSGGTGKVANGKIQVMKLRDGKTELGATWNYTSTAYAYRTMSYVLDTWAWGKNRNQSLISGEGLIVYNGMGATVKFRVAGQVELKPQYNIPTGYSIYGNNYPGTITLGKITVCNANGDEFNDKTVEAGGTGKVGSGKIQVMKLREKKTELGSVWGYLSNAYDYRTNPAALDTWAWGKNRNQTLDPGEALIVYNGMGDEIIFKINP